VASYGFRAVVERWTSTGYEVLATVEPGSTGLNGLDPASYALTGGLTLADYVGAWSSVRSTDIARTQTSGVASVTVPGIIRLVSQPLRPASATAAPTATSTVTPTATPTATTSPSATATATATATASPVASEVETDPLSTLSLTLGALACRAEDHR
jgi:hypothetical protein